MNRRKFLKKSSLATVGTMLVPSFLKAFDKSPVDLIGNKDKKLVIIQLGGGNDGLNTVIPFNNDIYYKNRPRLAVPKNKVLRLNDELGLNPVMNGLKNLYDQGHLSIINNVGYPNPNRSHFRSMDIWQSASDANKYETTGWLGRYLDSTCTENCNAHLAIEADDTLSLVMKGERVKALALRNPKKIRNISKSKQIQMLENISSNYHDNSNVSYLYKTLAETTSSIDYIYEKSKIYRNTVTYPNSRLGNTLKTIASFINSGLDTKVYYASFSGFDTHVNQKKRHEFLLKTYSQAVEVFVKDLKKHGNFDNTLIFTFSEFGRRVKQNASNGTDHGTANNVFMIGGKLKKSGMYNETPNLSDLDKGDLKFSVDFREIYATLLKKHLTVDDKQILRRNFNKLTFI